MEALDGSESEYYENEESDEHILGREPIIDQCLIYYKKNWEVGNMTAKTEMESDIHYTIFFYDTAHDWKFHIDSYKSTDKRLCHNALSNLKTLAKSKDIPPSYEVGQRILWSHKNGPFRVVKILENDEDGDALKVLAYIKFAFHELVLPKKKVWAIAPEELVSLHQVERKEQRRKRSLKKQSFPLMHYFVYLDQRWQVARRLQDTEFKAEYSESRQISRENWFFGCTVEEAFEIFSVVKLFGEGPPKEDDFLIVRDGNEYYSTSVLAVDEEQQSFTYSWGFKRKLNYMKDIDNFLNVSPTILVHALQQFTPWERFLDECREIGMSRECAANDYAVAVNDILKKGCGAGAEAGRDRLTTAFVAFADDAEYPWGVTFDFEEWRIKEMNEFSQFRDKGVKERWKMLEFASEATSEREAQFSTDRYDFRELLLSGKACRIRFAKTNTGGRRSASENDIEYDFDRCRTWRNENKAVRDELWRSILSIRKGHRWSKARFAAESDTILPDEMSFSHEKTHYMMFQSQSFKRQAAEHGIERGKECRLQGKWKGRLKGSKKPGTLEVCPAMKVTWRGRRNATQLCRQIWLKTLNPGNTLSSNFHVVLATDGKAEAGWENELRVKVQNDSFPKSWNVTVRTFHGPAKTSVVDNSSKLELAEGLYMDDVNRVTKDLGISYTLEYCIVQRHNNARLSYHQKGMEWRNLSGETVEVWTHPEIERTLIPTTYIQVLGIDTYSVVDFASVFKNREKPIPILEKKQKGWKLKFRSDRKEVYRRKELNKIKLKPSYAKDTEVLSDGELSCVVESRLEVENLSSLWRYTSFAEFFEIETTIKYKVKSHDELALLKKSCLQEKGSHFMVHKLNDALWSSGIQEGFITSLPKDLESFPTVLKFKPGGSGVRLQPGPYNCEIRILQGSKSAKVSNGSVRVRRVSYEKGAIFAGVSTKENGQSPAVTGTFDLNFKLGRELFMGRYPGLEGAEGRIFQRRKANCREDCMASVDLLSKTEVKVEKMNGGRTRVKHCAGNLIPEGSVLHSLVTACGELKIVEFIKTEEIQEELRLHIENGHANGTFNVTFYRPRTPWALQKDSVVCVLMNSLNWKAATVKKIHWQGGPALKRFSGMPSGTARGEKDEMFVQYRDHSPSYNEWICLDSPRIWCYSPDELFELEIPQAQDFETIHNIHRNSFLRFNDGERVLFDPNLKDENDSKSMENDFLYDTLFCKLAAELEPPKEPFTLEKIRECFMNHDPLDLGILEEHEFIQCCFEDFQFDCNWRNDTLRLLFQLSAKTTQRPGFDTKVTSHEPKAAWRPLQTKKEIEISPEDVTTLDHVQFFKFLKKIQEFRTHDSFSFPTPDSHQTKPSLPPDHFAVSSPV